MFSEYLVICSATLVGATLTLFSGFGLGTILVPVFGIFFPIEVSIALTAIIHFLNNLFKLVLMGRKADRGVVLRFGIPCLLAAFFGAWVLGWAAGLPTLFSYEIAGNRFSVSTVNFVIALVLVFFALFDLIPRLANLQFERKLLPVGGLLSGFFGGLSGNQGALRSAFLLRAGLTKESFIATSVVIACLADLARMSVYANRIFSHEMDYLLIGAATMSAFLGVFIGTRLLRRITVDALRYFVACLLIVFSLLLGAGII